MRSQDKKDDLSKQDIPVLQDCVDTVRGTLLRFYRQMNQVINRDLSDVNHIRIFELIQNRNAIVCSHRILFELMRGDQE